jgi:Hypothetical glycosyl hydrolase family 15
MQRLRRRVAISATILVTALAVTGAASSADGIGSWRFCTNCVENGGDLSRYGYVGLNAWYRDRVARLKAANPRLEALVYKDMASTRSYSCGGLVPAGIDYCSANTHHPDWFTLDAGGQRIEWSGFSGHWQMDVGTVAYQDQWAANVIAELRKRRWDGVFVDNANADQSGYLGGRSMQEYPTQPAYQAATRSFLARVCPRIIAAGFLCLPNIQANPTLAGAALWSDWIQFTSGGTREYWMKWGWGSDGRFGDGGWSDLQGVFAAVQNAGKIFLPVTYAPPPDVVSARYGRASFLLAWNGGPSSFIYAPTPEAQDPWSPEFAFDIGTPTGARYQVGQAWRRAYTGGTVVVNPSSTVAQTVTLGATYLHPDGSPVTSVVLQPMTGLVLRAVRCTVPRVLGMTIGRAKGRIRARDCSVGHIRRARSRRVGRVIAQSPRPGAVRRRGLPVRLVVGRR